jgi:uncharacterized protein YbbK (DUF523 family)
MKVLTLTAAVALLVPSLVWAHSGGLDQYGCHNDKQKSDYHCHEGKLKGRTFKSQDTMVTAHPEVKGGMTVSERKAANERAKKEKAEDKVKDGDKTTTDEYAKDAAKKKESAKTR